MQLTLRYRHLVLLRQSQIFPQYNSTPTAKVLMGIAPSSSVMFVSQLYTGGISDKEITKQSEILTLLDRGDNVMTDRGFEINDLLRASRMYSSYSSFPQ